MLIKLPSCNVASNNSWLSTVEEGFVAAVNLKGKRRYALRVWCLCFDTSLLPSTADSAAQVSQLPRRPSELNLDQHAL